MVHLLIRKHADIQGLLTTSDEETEPPGDATLLRSVQTQAPPLCRPRRSAGACRQLGHLSVVYIPACVSVLPQAELPVQGEGVTSAPGEGRQPEGSPRGLSLGFWVPHSCCSRGPTPYALKMKLKAFLRSLAISLSSWWDPK